MKIAFLGAGKMASAIARGLIASGEGKPTEMACLGGGGNSAPRLAEETGMRLAQEIDDLLAEADVLVLACKPQQFKLLDPRLGDLTRGKLVLSVLAGFTTERLAAFFRQARGVVAVMPNTPTQVRAGVTAWTARADLPEADAALVQRIFGCLGAVLRVEENLMNTVSAVSGSGPGFFFEVVAALEAAAEAAGLSGEQARLLARQTFIGSAKLLEQTGESPETLRNAVTSPNGSTYAGLQVFERRKLRETWKEVLAASVARSVELGKM